MNPNDQTNEVEVKDKERTVPKVKPVKLNKPGPKLKEKERDKTMIATPPTYKKPNSDQTDIPVTSSNETTPIKNEFKDEDVTKEKMKPMAVAETSQQPIGRWNVDFIKDELLLGITVCCAQIPESVAFAFMANVAPSIGIHSAWISGLIIALLGGRPGAINGFTGALAIIYATIIEKPAEGELNGEGVEKAVIAVMVSGFMIFFAGKWNLAKFICLVPASVMIGFCNGLAILIAMSQLHSFQRDHQWITGAELGWMALLAVVSSTIMEGLPRVPHKALQMIPSSPVAIFVCIVIEFAIIRPSGASTDTIGDISPFTMDTAFPMPFFYDPQFSFSKITWSAETVMDILVSAFLCATISMLESLMTIEVVNDILCCRSNVVERRREMEAMGVANAISGFMGGLGGHMMIGLSTITALNGGGRSRIAPTVAATGIMIVVMGAYPVLNFIPIASLAGIMFVVVFHTFKWFSIKMVLASFMPQKFRDRWNLICKVKRSDVAVMLFVTIFTIFFNLVYAVLGGIMIASLAYVWETSKDIYCESHMEGKKKIYEFDGDLFFASKMEFMSYFDVSGDPNHVEIHLTGSRMYDYSAIEALNVIHARYEKLDKKISVLHMCDQSKSMVSKAKDFYHISHGPLPEESREKSKDLPLFVPVDYEEPVLKEPDHMGWDAHNAHGEMVHEVNNSRETSV